MKILGDYILPTITVGLLFSLLVITQIRVNELETAVKTYEERQLAPPTSRGDQPPPPPEPRPQLRQHRLGDRLTSPGTSLNTKPHGSTTTLRQARRPRCRTQLR